MEWKSQWLLRSPTMNPPEVKDDQPSLLKWWGDSLFCVTNHQRGSKPKPHWDEWVQKQNPKKKVHHIGP